MRLFNLAEMTEEELKNIDLTDPTVSGKLIVVIEDDDRELEQGLKLEKEKGAILVQLAGDTKDLCKTHLSNCVFHTRKEGKSYERFYVGW